MFIRITTCLALLLLFSCKEKKTIVKTVKKDTLIAELYDVKFNSVNPKFKQDKANFIEHFLIKK